MPTLPTSSRAIDFSGTTILLRSSWQTVNIGDIGHSPGVITLLEKHLPEARLILWPDMLDRGVREMLEQRFPQLEILDGTIGEDGNPTTQVLADAFERADLLVHGSGPYVVALSDVEAWVRLTGKPYGIYGVTIDPLGSIFSGNDMPNEGDTIARQRELISALPSGHIPERLLNVLNGAAFVYCRDTLSLDYLRAQDVATPVLEFGPDGAFGIDLRDDPAADSFLRRHELAHNKFICVIPRLRYTPYHLTHDVPATPRDEARAAISEAHRAEDLDKLRDMIVRWVRATGLKVLVCPEMTYQVDVGRELFGRRLPDDVRGLVEWRPDYWLPDEACSTFARSFAVVSMDNHSPIFALTVGRPTIFIRQPTDTTKGQMWADVGLGDWYFEITETDGEAWAERLLSIWHDLVTAEKRVESVMRYVHDRQRETLDSVANLLPAAPIY